MHFAAHRPPRDLHHPIHRRLTLSRIGLPDPSRIPLLTRGRSKMPFSSHPQSSQNLDQRFQPQSLPNPSRTEGKSKISASSPPNEIQCQRNMTYFSDTQRKLILRRRAVTRRRRPRLCRVMTSFDTSSSEGRFRGTSRCMATASCRPCC